MLPKKIYLNWPKDCDFDEWELTAWSEEPINHPVREMQSREYTDLSQVWHPASEEPQERDAKILYHVTGIMLPGAVTYGVTTLHNVIVVRHSWQVWADINGLQAWAYLDDLLPKK